MSQSLVLITQGRPTLANLPVGLFGSVMSVTALAVAWRLAHMRYGAPERIAPAIAAVAVVAFVLVILGYAIKLVTAFAAVRDEFRHPIARNLFGTVLISLLQLPIVLEPYAHLLAQIMWMAGAVGMAFFAWLVVSRWMTGRQHVSHATPALLIPVVGVLSIPLALPTLGLPNLHGLMVAALAIGLFFGVLIFALIFWRLLFERPLPAALKPSLLILAAPFATGYSNYTLTVGPADVFAEALFVLTLFLLAVLIGQLRDLPLCCPFHVSWWSVSFPLASCSVAALRFANARPGGITDAVALALLLLATGVVAWLLVSTILELRMGGLPDADSSVADLRSDRLSV